MDWKRFFSDPATAVVLLSSGLIGFIVGVANGVVQKKHGGWPGFFAAICTAVAISMIVGLGIDGYVTNKSLQLAIVGVCALISDDIRAGFMTLGSNIRTDPLGALARIIDALRGRAPPPIADDLDPTPATPKE